ncbi:PilX N-terminal domain-containing pilus assembly protein [Marinimicrobium sp. C6131]|uniref:pilus assembly PilX family protein n=1 Tax=Marinimicrobium sp. C6131 TaxID=3022676 RepID=UPI00223CC5D7|nr:PilX N-terminal domain-containing pilus assembly protein [Marinimicrobium sp. C6131]UZJ44689.1 PilX N-terminal domain-containing pilus assembly protein [Marinimicrobium sp. C6131]
MVLNEVMQTGATPASNQRGAVLIVGLIMLLLMTIVGLAAIRGSGLQETMAGNMRERNVAFQVAEAGLRVGESRVENTEWDASDFDGGIAGFYRDLGIPANNAFDSPMRAWGDDEWDQRAIEADLELDDSVQDSPRYLVERVTVLALDTATQSGSCIDIECLDSVEDEFYRVTARGQSASGTSDAVVQSTYRAQ